MRRFILVVGLIISLLITGIAAPLPLAAAPFDGLRAAFADPRFQSVWSRSDAADVRGARGFTWGPAAWFDYAEFYRNSPNGLRTVQYFDKARMELNRPDGPPTNGLLVKELVSGRRQLGDNPYDTETFPAALIPIAGNPREANPAAPLYQSFVGVATVDNDYRDSNRLGQPVITRIDIAGNLTEQPVLGLPATTIVQYNTLTGHNIPRVFWDFMNRSGPIVLDGRVTSGPIIDWLSTLGLPITDPYWVQARVGDQQRDVLVQLFERRVLTYTPANPPAYQVEMGNVGQHYFQWRYPHLGTPWAAVEPATPLVYASQAQSAHWELYLPDYQGGGIRITSNRQETVAYSWRRSWDPARQRLVVDSRRADARYRQLYRLDPLAFYSGDQSPGARVERLTYTDGTAPPPPYYGNYLPEGGGSDYNPVVSPDGTKLIFASDRFAGVELFLALDNGNAQLQLTSRGCINQSPTWSPDGRTVFWVENCDGDDEIVSAQLNYFNDMLSGVTAELVNRVQWTDNRCNDSFARLSPDGNQIAYAADCAGNYDLRLLDLNDGSSRALTDHSGRDDSPTWSPDGRQLAFASDRDGDFEIYTLDLTRPAVVTQLTHNSVADRWPLWAQ